MNFYHKGGETLAWVVQRGGRCPIPGNIRGQVGRGSEQPGSGWRCPCSLQGGWTIWPLKVPSNPKHSMN